MQLRWWALHRIMHSPLLDIVRTLQLIFIQAIALATTSRLKLTLHCQLRGNLPKTDPKHTKACCLYKGLLYPESLRVFQSRLPEDRFPKESGTVPSP